MLEVHQIYTPKYILAEVGWGYTTDDYYHYTAVDLEEEDRHHKNQDTPLRSLSDHSSSPGCLPHRHRDSFLADCPAPYPLRGTLLPQDHNSERCSSPGPSPCRGTAR